ncbi:LysR substrate-binding domain-containing protein [Algihabitans albus]|uniref:LysR substrate-binding domain-containing protein n=1 Tax=Algihabitans albus TaxID=2164067 RepID=UPI000E5D38D1|nr:LysR substrate-binding domain-containing protein [Algihabitans albus]
MIIGDLLDARILVELRNRLSFAEAARSLNLPPATLSRRVARIEEQAGLRLFERTTRSVSVTAAGTVTVAHAERMIAEADAIAVSLDALRDTPVGRVRVSAPVILGQTLLGPIVAEFLRANPRCDLTLDLENRQVDLIEENFDVAIRVGHPGHGDLVARVIGHVEAALYRAARSISADGQTGETPTLKSLEGAAFGLLRSDDTRRPELTLVTPEGKQHRLSVLPQLVCLNPDILRNAALASDLTVVLPRMSVESDLKQGRLERLVAPWLAVRTPVHAVFTSRRLMRPAVRAFIELATEHLGRRLKQIEAA